MTIHELTVMNEKLKVNLTNDYYGAEYWNRIETKEYEPDTQWFVVQNCHNNTDFMDIGAANGAMTLLAAICGAKVMAYEPDPVIYSVLKVNVELNPNIKNKITLDEAAVSDSASELVFSKKANPEILSSILFGGGTTSDSPLPVRNLKQEIEKFHRNSARKLVIKMDIEGAEWKTLGNPHVLQSLNAHNATLLLAVHPGFAKPMPKWATRILIARVPWLINQFKDSLNLYNNLSKHAEILRTNHNPVSNRFKFAMLIIAGYHEYIIRFNK